MITAIRMKESFGSPGIRARPVITAAAIHSGRLLLNSCLPKSVDSVLSEDARVTTMPPATETSSDGIMVTRPSPTVSTV